MGTNNVNHTGYTNYLSPSFKTTQIKTDTISPYTKITYTTAPDKFVKENKSENPEEKGLSFGAKVTAIAAGAALAAGAIYLSVKKGKLPEHIDFKPAKTIAEARKFARKQLGIKKFKINDLEMANYINEGLTNASNISKGKIVLPKIVNADLSGGAVQCMNWDSRTLSLNPECYRSVTNEKITDKFHNLYHELGHLNHHCQNSELMRTNYMTRVDQAKNFSENDMSVMYKHLNLMKESGITDYVRNDISKYAIMAPNEFVAEVYGLMMSGKKLPEKVMELYNKYGGPKIGVLAA